MEKYKLTDEAKIKELNLSIERFTVEVTGKQGELEKEITETQTAQIELDKTAEEFRGQHDDRHKIFEQWQEVTENIARRDLAIRQEGEQFADIKMKINGNKDALEERKHFLGNEKTENKKLEMQNTLLERQIITQRTDNKRVQEQLNNL